MENLIKHLSFIALSFCSSLLLAQNSQNDIQSNYQISIVQAKKPIKIDGILDDEIWKTAPIATNFWRKFPTDGGQAKRQTKVQIAYDDNFIYFGVEAIDSGKAVIQSQCTLTAVTPIGNLPLGTANFYFAKNIGIIESVIALSNSTAGINTNETYELTSYNIK